MAKNKKIYSNLDNLELGNKLKDISIDMKKYSLTNLITLIALNIVLVAVMIYYIAIANNALIITIAIVTVAACMIWSVMSYLKSIIKIKYSIYQNGIVKDFDSSKTIGIFANLNQIIVTETLLDKIGKNKTKSLILKFNKPGAKTLRLYCINEDVEKLKEFLNDNKSNALVIYNEYDQKTNNPSNKEVEQKQEPSLEKQESKTEKKEDVKVEITQENKTEEHAVNEVNLESTGNSADTNAKMDNQDQDKPN